MKFTRIQVPLDGNCFFHSFILGMKVFDPDFRLTVTDLRYLVAKVIKLTPELYEDLITEWLDFQRITLESKSKMTPEIAGNIIYETNEWTTSTMIHILAVVFNVKIIIHEKINGKFFSESFPSAWKKKVGNESNNSDKEINILKEYNHFDYLSTTTSVSKKNENHEIYFFVGTSLFLLMMMLSF